ncbi:hypothetical protein JK358_38760, partial [Nocardia sp. 2]
AAQLEFWERGLAELPDRLELPADRPYPLVATGSGDKVDFELPVWLQQRLRQIAREHDATVFMVVQAALSVVLSKVSGSTDVAVGVAVAGRTDAAVHDLVGFFVNTLVLRVDVAGDPGFAELLGRVRERSLDVFAHQDVPFEVLVDRVNPVRSQSHHPLVQVLLAWQNDPGVPLALGGVRVSVIPVHTRSARMDLSFHIGESVTATGEPAGIAGSVEYRTDVFDPATVRGLVARLQRVLEAVAGDPGRVLSTIELRGESEQAQLTTWSNRAILTRDAATDDGVSIPESFAVQVARTPDAVAVVFEDRS